MRDLVLNLPKHKIPRPYSGAEDSAPSLTGSQDDDLFDKDRTLILSSAVQALPLLDWGHPSLIRECSSSAVLSESAGANAIKRLLDVSTTHTSQLATHLTPATCHPEASHANRKAFPTWFPRSRGIGPAVPGLSKTALDNRLP